jgi:peptidoglycan hydrolase-like protein with peptidoglycan-binding domain
MKQSLAAFGAVFWVIGATVALGANTTSVREAQLSAQVGHYNTPANIRAVQQALRDRGYYHGVLDGHIGPDTANAIQLFQVNHDLKVRPLVSRELLLWLGFTRRR